MKVSELLTLNDALNYQLTYRQDDPPGKTFLRDIQHFKIQYALRKNLTILGNEANEIRESLKSIKDENKRKEAINSSPDLSIDFYKINFKDIPEDAPVDSGGMWILEHFIEEPEKVEIVKKKEGS